jgi:serine/threonine-protein kinase RsbW
MGSASEVEFRTCTEDVEEIGMAERRSLSPDAHAPSRARKAVDLLLADHLSPEQMDDARLAVSELVTNAVRHGNIAEDGGLELNVNTLDGHVRVTVSQSGPPFEVPANAMPDHEGPGGRGLSLVEAVSDRWGLGQDPAAVWFEIDRD